MSDTSAKESSGRGNSGQRSRHSEKIKFAKAESARRPPVVLFSLLSIPSHTRLNIQDAFPDNRLPIAGSHLSVLQN